jgi:dipeptidyl aminopeptidase/acylaminoacyl peptidase
LIAVGCGSPNDVAGPGPVKRYLVYEKATGEKGVWIADTDGSSPRLLVPDARNPAISPNGASVAYVGGCSAEDICKGTYVISTAGGEPRRISSGRPTFPPAAFTWSPDSKRLLLTRGSTPFERELVSIDAADGSTSTIAKGRFYGASFSPDAKQIVYAKATSPTAHSGEGAFDLFVAASDGSESKQITHSGDSVDPAWGPKSIAFSRIVWDAAWGRNEIWRINPDGSGRETITGPLLEMLRGTSGFDGLVPVAWSDDGQALLGGMLTSSGAEPFAIDPRNGRARALENVEEFIHTVAISHDGQSVLAYTYPPMGESEEENAAVLIVPYGGGKPTVVARGAWAPSWNR